MNTAGQTTHNDLEILLLIALEDFIFIVYNAIITFQAIQTCL